MLFALAQWMLTINLDEQIDTQKANHLLKVTQLVSDSNSRTCEIGLTTHSGVPYQSLVYLINECTTVK